MSPSRRAGEASPPLDLGLPREFNLAAHLLDRALESGWSDRVALVCGDEIYTYGQLADEVNRAGNLLLGLGVQAEQRVALLVGDSPAFATVFLGAMKIGAVPVPFQGMLRTHEYRYLLQDSRARVLLVEAALLPRIQAVLMDSPWLEHVLVCSGSVEGYQSLPEGLMDAPAELAPAPTSPDDVAFWIYSSGATGFPKAAVHLHHDALYCCRTFAEQVLAISGSDVTLSVPRLSCSYGLGNSLFFPLYAGARAILLPGEPQTADILAALARHRPTLYFDHPSGYARLLEAPQADLSSLRLCLSAGETLAAHLLFRWKDRFGLEILDGVSSTEALHVFLSNRPGEVRPGSSGRPVPGYEVRLEGEDGAEVAPGEIGDLLVRGDSTAPCYWNQHRKSVRAMLGPWLVTGDKFTRDEEGFFYYAGRTDDMIRVSGTWITPGEIESRLLEEPEVEQAAVVASQDEQGLTRLRAFVVLGPGAEPTHERAERLRAQANRDQDSHRHVRWLEFVPQLPRTATGKLQRYRLRDGA